MTSVTVDRNIGSAEDGSANGVLVIAMLTTTVGQFGLIPLLVGRDMPAAIFMAVLIVVTTPLHWGLLHESFHGLLSRRSTTNRMLGRCLAIPLGMSWDLLRFGHLNHHDSNRHMLDRPEVIEEGKTWRQTAPGYFWKLLGGHAMLSAISSLLAWLPAPLMARIVDRIGGDEELTKFRTGALRNLRSPDRRRRVCIDSATSVVLFGVALYLWGPAWPAFLISMLLRFAVLSLMDNAPHYGTALDSGTAARNTSLPFWAKPLVLHQNFHGVHHARPELRWHQLQPQFHDSNAVYNGSWIGCIAKQLRGPVGMADLSRIAGGR